MKSQKIDSISKSDSEPARNFKISPTKKTSKCPFDYKKAFSDIAFTDFSRSAKYKTSNSTDSSNQHALTSLSSYSTTFDETSEASNQYKPIKSHKRSVKKCVGGTNVYGNKTLMGNWLEERILEKERNLMRLNYLQAKDLYKPASVDATESPEDDQFLYNQNILKLVYK